MCGLHMAQHKIQLSACLYKVARASFTAGTDLSGFEVGSRDHSASYIVGNGVSFPGVRRSKHVGNNSPVTSSEVKNVWSWKSSHPYASMACKCTRLLLLDSNLYPAPVRLSTRFQNISVSSL